MRPVPTVLALLLGVAASLLVACGGGGAKLIPGADAGPLQSDFDAVASAVASGDCQAAAQAVQKASNDLAGLPASVDQRLVRRLRSGIDRLRERAPIECAQGQTQTQTQETVTTVEPTTTETTTTTTPTDTTTETTPTTTETTPTTTTPPTTTTDTGGAGDGGTGDGTTTGDGTGGGG